MAVDDQTHYMNSAGTFSRLVRAADEIIAAMHKGDLTPDEAAEAWQAERAKEGLDG